MPPPSISIPGSQPDHPTGSTTGTSSTTSAVRSEEHTSELQSQSNLVCRLLLEKTSHTRIDLGLHLLLHAVLERVHLRTDLPAIDPRQDGAGADRQRVRRRRHLSLGLADGGGRA